jgi:hypothetical protein
MFGGPENLWAVPDAKDRRAREHFDPARDLSKLRPEPFTFGEILAQCRRVGYAKVVRRGAVDLASEMWSLID